MAKVKFKLSGTACGPEGNRFAGEVIEVDEKEAERLHADGQGEVVVEEKTEAPKKEEAKKETATNKRATAGKSVAVSTGGKK